MRYLVTGGAGFIGSHIVDRLVADGQEVRVLDNFFTGKMEHIEHNLSKIELVKGDIVDLDTVVSAVEGVDYVLHQAALRSVPVSVAAPLPYCDVNIKGTMNLLVASRDAGVKRMVVASSSSVYGNSPELPKEETMYTVPVSPYAVTKLAGEHFCRTFTSLYGIETVSLRYFNVFGPRQDPKSQYATVIPLFITALREGRQPVIFGDGLQSRDFTYVENVVDANLRACTAPSEAAGEAFNIACGARYTLADIVTWLNELLGTDIPPILSDDRAGDVKHTLANIDKAKRLLGYEPSVSFREGLALIVRWMIDNPQ